MDQSTILTKVCNTCHIEKPLTEYFKDSECRLGHKNRCRSCDRIYARARYARPEVQAHRLEQEAARRAADPDKAREKNRRTYHANTAKYREGQRQYRQARSDEAWLRARERTRRNKYTKETGLPAEMVDYRAILDRDGFVCHICGEAIEPAVIRNVNFDHIIPPSQGGTHTPENIAVSHIGCNIRKRNKLPVG